MSTAPVAHAQAAHDQTAHASPGELLSSVTKDLSDLMRQELELAKAEARQSVTRAGKGAGMLSGAAVGGHQGGRAPTTGASSRDNPTTHGRVLIGVGGDLVVGKDR